MARKEIRSRFVALSLWDRGAGGRVRILLTLVLSILLAPSLAEAQYFGRNKVQYKTFHFQVLKTEHFDIYYYPEEQEATSQVARMAERWYSRLSQILDHQLTARQPLVLYASHADFEQTNIISGVIEEGTGGVTEGLKGRVVLPLAGTLAETDHVLGHELVHAFQYDLASYETETGMNALELLPLWFVEGMAEYLSVGSVDAHTAMWIRDASRQEKLPDIGHLDDPDLFPYRWGQALWAYLAGRWGDRVVAQMYREGVRSGSAISAIEYVSGMPVKDISRDWHTAIHAQYDPILNSTRRADTYGPSMSGRKQRERFMYVSPALSPDGRQIVYFSERSFLSVDLYLADAETGKVIRRLVSTATNPHFTSLQFIGSAGSWSPDGKQFVFGAIRKGQPALALIDVRTGKIVREIPFPSLGEILNPAWSPDGRSIAFSASAGGFSDLFIYDLEEGSLRQVTKDEYADLQPAWAQDGFRLAFVTDRFSTKLPTLQSGTYGLAAFDLRSDAIEALPTFESGKSINPQWAGDNRLYFLSDRSGLTNVYVLDTTTGQIRQVTNVDAGVSGITALSPALSLSADEKQMAFSAYEDGGLNIYTARDREVLAGGPLLWPHNEIRADALPPQQRASDQLLTLLRDASTGLPSAAPSSEPYHPTLSLDYLGAPYVDMGVSTYGTSMAGSFTFLWSDMLSNHNLMAAIDTNTYGESVSDLAKNTGGLLEYRNLTHRWNWGVALQQYPIIYRAFLFGPSTLNGEPVVVEKSVTERQTNRGINGTVAYPLSQIRRIEFGTGYTYMSFEEKVRTVVSSQYTGNILTDDTATQSLADSLHLGSFRAAAIADSSIFGATSPIAGMRSRFEVAPTFGSLSYTGAIVDYRRYFMPVSFYTIAGRILHVGRYGSGAEDGRMSPMFVGYPELVRGYGIGSYDASECTPSAASSCPEFDRLFGSRMLVGNLELRFPLLRPFGVRSGMYGPVPVEVAAFADGGVAWNRRERPTFLGGDRRPVASSGVTFRVNLMGIAIAQIDLARPFQRPSQGWVWGFTLSPGF